MMKKLLVILSLAFSVNAFSETKFNVENELQNELQDEIAITINDDASVEENKSVDYRSYHFGQIPVGHRRSVTYTVTNVGPNVLNFQTTYLWGAGYQSYHGCFGALYPRQRCQFTVVFAPMFEGFHSGNFEILFYPYSAVRVNLSGYAIRY